MSCTVTLVGVALVSLQCGLGIQVLRVFKEGMESKTESQSEIRTADGYVISYEKGCFVETSARRADLLQETLKAFGYTIRQMKESQSSFLVQLGEENILFEQTQQGNYTALFIEQDNEESARKKAESIYEHYARLVQEKTYQLLLKRAKEKGYLLESEAIGEDQSIKLSFVVGE